MKKSKTLEMLDDLYFSNTLFCIKKNDYYYTDGFIFKWSKNKNKALFRNKEFWIKKFGDKIDHYKLIDYTHFMTKKRTNIGSFYDV